MLTTDALLLQFLHDLEHASLSDDCSVAHPLGRKQFDWECDQQCQLAHRHRRGFRKLVPEALALCELPEWQHDPPLEARKLPFCRFKRDVWMMADHFANEWIKDAIVWSDDEGGLDWDYRPRLASTEDSERYESVFSMDPKSLTSFPGLGPHENWVPVNHVYSQPSLSGSDDSETEEDDFDSFAVSVIVLNSRCRDC